MSSPATSSPSTSSVLLPTNVKPIKYTIELTPSFVSFTFTGSNEIDLEVVAPTTTIVLHAAELEIHSAVLRTTCATSGEKLELAASSLTLLESEQRLVVSFDREIAVGRAVLLLRFTGTLNDSLAGFYRSSYKLVSIHLTSTLKSSQSIMIYHDSTTNLAHISQCNRLLGYISLMEQSVGWLRRNSRPRMLASASHAGTNLPSRPSSKVAPRHRLD